MTIEEARKLLSEYVTKESLIKHSEAVRICMQGYAKHFGEDEEKWGVVGLLHDIDFEKYPDTHPLQSKVILKDILPEDEIEAIQGHGKREDTRTTNMAKALFAVDNLSGLVTACAFVKPSKLLADVEVKSVKKKFKDKAFAANCSRENIMTGTEELGLELEQNIEIVLNAMKNESQTLGM